MAGTHRWLCLSGDSSPDSQAVVCQLTAFQARRRLCECVAAQIPRCAGSGVCQHTAAQTHSNLSKTQRTAPKTRE